MSAEPIRVFLVDDDQEDYLLTRDLLADIDSRPHRLDWTPSYDEALRAMSRGGYDVYLIDYRLGAHDGLELLRAAIANGCRAPLILLTGQGDREVDLEAMKAGAADFVVKGASSALLERSIRYAIERKQAEEALRRLHDELEMRVQQRTAELAETNRALQASLHEKEVLLREIHHRVKNNLQIISSLLKLQTHQLKDPRVLAMFKDSQDRVKAMALIHEKLYRSSNLARIDFADYIRSLAAYLLRAFASAPEAVQLELQAERVCLRVDSAIPCALLIHELMANSLKHAFPEGRGTIRITIHPEGADRYLLHYTDDGVGWPGDLDLHRSESLGLQLVAALVDQLDGKIEFTGRPGTTITIRFADVQYRERG